MNWGQDGQTALDEGIALFNGHDFFHAHEVWEEWWRSTTRPEKRCIQGMIQVAVAMHHFSQGNRDGARSVMERAQRNLEKAADSFHGVDLSQLRDDLQRAIGQLSSNEEVTFFEIIKN